MPTITTFFESLSLQTIFYTVFLMLLSVNLLQYFRKTKISIFHSNEKFADFLSKAPSLKSKRFYPFPLVTFALGQCYLSFKTFENDRHLIQTRESFDYPRGGRGHVEWITESGKTHNFVPNIIAFILPGIRTKPNAPYLRDMYIKLLKIGIRPVLFVPRFNDTKLVVPKTGYLDFMEDMHHGVLYVKSKYPQAKLIAIGHSYGANTLTNYLAMYSQEKHIVAAVAIANPFNLVISSQYAKGTVIERHLVRGLKEIISGGMEDIVSCSSHYGWSVPDILKSNTVQEVDDNFTSKLLGCKNAVDYYEMLSSGRRLKDVKVPFLLINAEDDPFIDPRGLPKDIHLKNKNILFVLTKKGAHIGWIEGVFRLKRWYVSLTTDFVKWIVEKEQLVAFPDSE